MYSVVDYGRMLADRVRVDAYRAALAAAVRPGAVVLDLGAGTGFFSLEACRLGAAKVYAVETNDAVSLLAAHARRNGMADRIEIVARPSTEVTLDRRVDVVVSDLRGVLPLFEGHLDTLVDARERLLAPDGVLLPARDELQVAVVEAPELYGSLTGGFADLGFDLDEARALVLNVFADDRRSPVRPEQLVSAPARWLTIDYGERSPPLHEGSVSLVVERAATAHGLAMWFDATIHGAIRLTTAPGSDRVYGRGFLPWLDPVDLEPGDRVDVDLAARRSAADHEWAWSSTVRRPDAGARGGSRTVASFRQSTFLSTVLAPSALLKESSSYRPALGARGAAVRDTLAAMTGERSVAELGAAAWAAHPAAFASEVEAVEAVRRLAKRYG